MKKTCLIEDLGAQGHGIVHDDNRTLFVPFALRGERVEIETDKKTTKLLRVIEPSPLRVAPSCPHYLRCGGCLVQHFEIEAYARWKTRTLKTQLEKMGISPQEMRPIAVSKPRTRRRARFAATNRQGQILFGYNTAQSSDIIAITDCAILHPDIQKISLLLKPFLPSWLKKNKENGDVQISMLPKGLDIVFIGGELTLDLRQDLGLLAEQQQIAQISWKKSDTTPTEPIAHRLPLSLTFGERRVPFPAGSFLQATEDGETALISFVKEFADKTEKVLDLFSGLGGFGLSLTHAKHITFSDIDGPAMAALQSATRDTPYLNAEKRNLFREPYTAKECNAHDVVIFDPPRAGAKEQARELAHSNVKKIIAISCDMASFARDAKILIEGGYTLNVIQPVDQFLWSNHLECAALFTK